MSNTKGGITLIALVVTVIILMILAAVAISTLINGDGIIDKTIQAAEEWNTVAESNDRRIENAMEISENLTNPERNALKILVNSGDDGLVILPIDSGKVDWGDGIITGKDDYITESSYKIASTDGIKIAELDSRLRHQYSTNNKNYTITITGITSWPGYGYDNIIKVLQWGNMELESVNFGKCENLESIASPTEKSFKNTSNFTISFKICRALTSIPSDLFKYCSNVTNFDCVFENCSSLTSIPSSLFANCSSALSFTGSFSYCTSLTSIPPNLFANCPNIHNLIGTFFHCTNLTGQAIPLWERMEDGATYNYESYDPNSGNYRYPNGDGCYALCTGLSNYDSIPEYWKMSVT